MPQVHKAMCAQHALPVSGLQPVRQPVVIAVTVIGQRQVAIPNVRTTAAPAIIARAACEQLALSVHIQRQQTLQPLQPVRLVRPVSGLRQAQAAALLIAKPVISAQAAQKQNVRQAHMRRLVRAPV